MASFQDDVMAGGEVDNSELAYQITEVQGMIHELKDGFLLAMQELSKIQDGDQALQEKVETNKVEQQQQLKEVVDMVITLKSEFEEVVSQLQEANEGQQNLQKQVESLQYERDVLLDELERAGKTHRPDRKRNSNKDRQSLGRDRSDHHSDHDSGVNPLGLSDDEMSQSGLSPMVKPYIASLRKAHQAHLFEDGYESDSSVAKSATQTLNLGRSFGQILKLNSYSSEEESSECGSLDRCSKHSGSSIGQKSLSLTPRVPRRKTSTGSVSSMHKVAEAKKHKVPPHEQAMHEGQKSRYAKELLESERLFCSSIWTLLDVFMEPLKESGIIESHDLNLIFPPSVYQLYEQHCCILKRLEERMVSWKWQGVIGDIFAWFINKADADILGMYRAYLQDIPDSVRTVNRLYTDSPSFRKYLKKCQRNSSCKGHDLVHFLLMPVQRIPQYILLLKQLLKLTDVEHPDHFNLENSVERLRKFLHELNDSVEQAMKLVRNDGSMESVRSPRSSNNSVKSSVSSHDGFQLSTATKDSGIHSNGEEQTPPSLSPEINKKTLVSQFKSRNAKLLKEEMSKKRAVRPKETIENGSLQDPGLKGQGDSPSPRNKNRTNKEKPVKVRRSSLGDKTNGAMEINGGSPADATVRLRKKKMENRSKTMSNFFPDHVNVAALDMPKRHSVDVKALTAEENYALNCQTLPTRGKKARKLKVDTMLAEVEESCVERLNLDGSSLPRLPDYGDNVEKRMNGEEVLYTPSTGDSPRRLSKQKLGMINKWRSQGDILGEEDSDMQQMILAKSMTDIAPPDDEVDSQYIPQTPESVTCESEAGSTRGINGKKKSKKKDRNRHDLECITPPPPPDAFKTKKKTFKDTVKNMFKRSSRHVNVKNMDFTNPKPPEEFRSRTPSEISRNSSNFEASPDPHMGQYEQFRYESAAGEVGPGSAIGYSDGDEEYDEDGEPCSAV